MNSSSETDLVDEILSLLVNATHASAAVQQDYDLLKTLHSSLVKQIDGDIMNLLDKVIDNISKSPAKPLKSDYISFTSQVVDILDNLLEKCDMCLDQSKNPSTSTNTHDDHSNILGINAVEESSRKLQPAKHSRPQDKFTDIDNSNTPFIPKLKSKPNAIIPLKPYSLEDVIIYLIIDYRIKNLSTSLRVRNQKL